MTMKMPAQGDPPFHAKYLPRSVRTVTVIEVVLLTGSGGDNDPLELVTEFWDHKGTFLARRRAVPDELQGALAARST